MKRYADICAGISAATVAWKPLGWRASFYAEADKFPSAVLRHHYPDSPNLGDITRFEDWPDASLDVLIGGTPCQGFSVAGLRKGLDDDRSNLALCFGRIAQRYKPRWLVWENVPGVRSSGEGRDLGAFLSGLGELGYGLAWRSLDAQYAGLAQRRERLFVVGHLGDWRPAAAVLFEREGLRWDSAPSREAGQRVAPCLESGANRSGGTRPPGSTVDTAETLIASHDPACTLMARDYKGPLPEADLSTVVAQRQAQPSHRLDSDTYVAHALRADGFDASEDGTGRGTPIVPIDLRQASRGEKLTNNRSHGSGGAPGHGIGNPGDPAFTVTARGQAIAFSSKDYGADAGSLAPTLRAMGHDGSHANAGGQVAVVFAQNQREETLLASGWAVRRLTPTECERLQGFPDGYTDIPWRGKPNAPDGPRYKALGNSIAVPCLRWIGERIELCEDAMKDLRKAAA